MADPDAPAPKKRRITKDPIPLGSEETFPPQATEQVAESETSGGEPEVEEDSVLCPPLTLVDVLEKFPPPCRFKFFHPHAKFELKIYIPDLQRMVLWLLTPDQSDQAFISSEARKDFLFSKILGPDGGNLRRLSKRGAQVELESSSSIDTPDPVLYILISSDNHSPLCLAAMQVDNLLEALMDALLGQCMLHFQA